MCENPRHSRGLRLLGARLLTGSADNTGRLWDAATGKELRAFKGHEGLVMSVAFSRDGARVLTGSDDKTARLWDISAIPPGSIFDIACAWLPGHYLSGLSKDYGLDLSGEAPICQKDETGKSGFRSNRLSPSMSERLYERRTSLAPGHMVDLPGRSPPCHETSAPPPSIGIASYAKSASDCSSDRRHGTFGTSIRR